MDDALRPGERAGLVGWGLAQRGEHHRPSHRAEGTQPRDPCGPEGPRLADGFGAGLRLRELVPDGQVAREQAEADGDLVGVQAGADEVVEVVAVVQLLDRRLGPPAAAGGGGQPPRADGARVGDGDPGAAPVVRGARAEGEQRQVVVPGAGAQADRPALALPAPLLPAEGGQAAADRRRAGAAEDEGPELR